MAIRLPSTISSGHHRTSCFGVAAGLAFRRARLSAIYSVLRGKDLETGEFRDEAREQQFARMKDAQQRALDLKNWHGFMQCLRQAGFRTESMINSQVALIYTYLLYLIGRTELRVSEHDLRSAIASWFFMASLTGRYTGSSESAMESDLALLRDCEGPQEFLRRLSRAESIALTSDFWDVTLPNELATSAARSPSLAAFNASLVVQGCTGAVLRHVGSRLVGSCDHLAEVDRAPSPVPKGVLGEIWQFEPPHQSNCQLRLCRVAGQRGYRGQSAC